MHDPKLEEFCRVRGIQDCKPNFFRDMQQYVRDVVDPAMAENADLKRKLEDLSAKAARRKAETVAP